MGALLLAACNGAGPADTAASPTSGTESPAPDTPFTPGARDLEDAECASASGGADGVLAFFTDLRVGTHDGYDRVTLEFGPAEEGEDAVVPKFTVRAIEPPIREDGRGNVVEMEGEVFAEIRVHGASGVDLSGEEFQEVYTGPEEFKREFPVLREAQQTGDFEATLSWALGLSQRSCWAVFTLDDPARLVVDLPH